MVRAERQNILKYLHALDFFKKLQFLNVNQGY